MALWGKTDTEGAKPKYLSVADKEDTYFVDTTEVFVETNRDKGIQTPGWNLYKTYTDTNGNTRHKNETLVPMKVSALSAGDQAANTDIIVNS